jgi:hypothetical protein
MWSGCTTAFLCKLMFDLPEKHQTKSAFVLYMIEMAEIKLGKSNEWLDNDSQWIC